MQSSCKSEESHRKKKYIFFSDPDVILKRAETSAVAAQIKRDREVQQISERQAVLSVPTLDIKSLEHLLPYHPVQPYPFTFINAVKQKFALGGHPDTKAKTEYPNSQIRSSFASSVLRANCKQNLYQVVRKMDFIKPLKIPDLKISPKTLDFSSRESSVSKELPSMKSELAAKEFAHDRFDKTVKVGERVQRKLDFSSSDGPSAINCESIEPLKAPNVSIAFNLNKKKENVRDNSREKENRSKRIKRDESTCVKKDESVQDLGKRGRSPKHISRRDGTDSGAVTTRLKNDRLPFHAARNNDALSTKSKVRNFITSTAKKDNDKRQKFCNAQSMDLMKDVHLESKSRTCGNKVDFLSSKVLDKVTRDNNSMIVLSSSTENKFKEICHSRQMEDSKYKCDSDNRQSKQDKPNTIHKEQIKRVSDKNKSSNNKMERKIYSANSEEDVECTSETNSSKNRINIFPVNSVQQSKDKDPEIMIESKQNINSVRSAKASENLKYSEHSATQSASTNAKQDEESYSQSIATTKQTTTNDATDDIDVDALPNALYDPRRISFRDNSYSQQEEFHKLTTPGKIDVMLKSKQRRYLIQSSDSEVDPKSSKFKPIVKCEEEQEKTQLIHPTALHMQFQAELHLLDSFNESIRQVMDVEKCLYNTKCEQESKSPQKENKDEGVGVIENRVAVAADNDVIEQTWKPHDYTKNDIIETWKSNDDTHVIREYHLPSQGNVDEPSDNYGKFNKAVVKVMEVQTQTVNDMATQTDTYVDKRKVQNRFKEIYGNVYERSFLGESENAQLTLDSTEQFKDIGQLEEVSQSRIRTMSEISLHETTSSIKTETGTEISISTRDLTCSYKSKEFNKYLGLEIAQLLEDEEQRHDRFEMLFKSREKTLNDRTKKLVELEEQKRALKDTGQDSRISSVKKKQRALLLKLQQEKDEMNRLKQLHEYTSQERKLVLTKQKELFNPQMSTKNILTKLKRSADSQSPRRLSGPMKGYDIRSNSSISSLIDSDKSHHDRSQIDTRLQASESDLHLSKLDLPKSENFVNLAEESNTSATRFDEPAESNEQQEKNLLKSQKSVMSNYELKSRKYEEKMPKADVLRLKQNQLDMESKRIQDRPIKIKRLLEKQELIEVLQTSRPELDASVLDPIKCDSDTVVEKLSKKSRTLQMVDPSVQTTIISKEEELPSDIIIASNRSMEEETNSNTQDIPKATKLSQISEDVLQTNISSKTKKIDKSITSDRDISKKLQHNSELRTSAKRRSSKYQRTKSSILTENILRSKSHVTEEFIKHHDKRTRLEDELLQLDDDNDSSVLGQLDLNKSQDSLQALINHSKTVKDKNSKLINKIINDYENKKNISGSQLNRKLENGENLPRSERIVQNVSTSQINTFATSHHSSEESEKSFTRSVVLRLQDRNFKTSKKPEQILTARETALASRKNCIEEWIAWDARLRTEEDRVTRMEQAALKLVTATSNVLSQQDTTFSSDTMSSDVEGRIEILTEKLAERRIEMSRLKREVRKQAKQKLYALEANLLNQIKRYDTTILEMHKMLESKKAIKDKNKLAIEPKSLADFKIPEIPLKRIQDIYNKNSDLLRSRSESDLLSTRNEKDSLHVLVTYDRHENNSSQKSTESTDTKSANASKLKNTTDTTNHSAQSIFEEYTSKEACEKLRTTTSVSISSDVHSEKYAVSASTANEKQLGEFLETKPYSVSEENIEDIQTIISTAKSESEIQTVSDAKSSENGSIINTESPDSRLITHTSDQMKTHATKSEIVEEVSNVDYSKSISSKSDYVTENAAQITVAASNHETLNFSKKLDFLQLNNKNLNEDISSLENGLKVLTEMMSHFNNKTNEKSKVDNDERSTSHDISEIISKSVFSDKMTNIENEEKRTISLEREINTDHPSISTNNKSNDLSHNEYISERIDSDMSAVIPEEALTLSNSPQEIDYEAKSKEIMNEIEKSIISEHTKMARGDYNVSSVLENDMQNLRKDNEELLSDLVSLEQDVKSISEILSKVSESRKSLDRATNTAMRIIDSKENVIAQADLNEVKLKENIIKNQDVTNSSKRSEFSSIGSIHSPIIAGHRSKNNCEMNSHDDLQSMRNTISNQASRILSEDLKSSDDIPEILETEASVVDDLSKNSKSDEKDIRTTALNDTGNSILVTTTDQNRSGSAKNVSLDKDDWTISESFEVPQNEISIEEEGKEEDVEFEDSRSNSNNSSNKKNVLHINDTINQEIETNLMNNVDTLILVSNGKSANIAVHNEPFENVITKPHIIKSNDEFDDILDIIAEENYQNENVLNDGNRKFDNLISDSIADLLDKVESIVEDNEKITDNNLKGILYDSKADFPVNNRAETVPDISILSNDTQNKINVEDVSESNNIRFVNRGEIKDASLRAAGEINDRSAVNIDLRMKIDSKESLHEPISEAQEIVITELDLDSVEDHILPELEINAKIELAEDEEFSNANDKENHVVEGNRHLEIQECLEPILEQDSSDGEQLDNLVEITISRLDTIEKPVALLQASTKPMTNDEVVLMQAEETQQEIESDATNISPSKRIDETMQDTPIIDNINNINKTFDILKTPDYEDISEESFEVSEILDKNECSRTPVVVTKKFTGLPEKYQATQKSEEVLRILDEISQKSSSDSANDSPRDEKNARRAQNVTENISEVLGAEIFAKDNVPFPNVNQTKDNITKEFYETGELINHFIIGAQLQENCKSAEVAGLIEEKSSDGDDFASKLKNERLHDDKSSRIIYELRKKVSRLQEQDGSSESEAGDTPRGVPEIEMDSPRDFNDSRLDIDILDDDLLSGDKTTGTTTSQNIDVNTNLHSTSLVTTSEKDIEAMIDKLKASLEQPGLEVAELEAKLLRIEQLQIELEIKKLEAEEVSYYVREIPNKPPPPYTPPGDGRLSASLGSPSLLAAVIPSNVEELTSFTEKATAVIYNTKLAGEDIASLEAPPEIYELTKEKNEIVTKDQRIYNTFLFDLCKETIAEVYRAEYEKPGPSWTRPNVKTKPTMKVPKTVGELTEYVAKEVATLFGFKTRLQRENMVMRWSRKRRDRVDELLAREAQAEEDEWTKFHHDELAVKNGLTVAIMDSLMIETANVVKTAYGKKRRMMV